MAWPFAAAALLYLAFRLWYDNLRGALTAAEIDAGIAALRARGVAAPQDFAALRAFLEADDGREFVMLNLVKVEPGPVRHPETGAEVSGRDLLQHYSRHFIRKLVRRGGHPALAALKVGPYVDSWAVPPDPGWSIVGLMRYRSRRDLLALAADPAFGPIHQFKTLGTAATFSFPTRPFLMLYAGPRTWVALLLLAASALVALMIG